MASIRNDCLARHLSHYFPIMHAQSSSTKTYICLRKHTRLNAMQLPHRAPFREAMAVINRCGPHHRSYEYESSCPPKQQDSDNGRVNLCFTGAAQRNTRKRWEASNRIQHWCGDFFYSFIITCVCLWLIVIESGESVHGLRPKEIASARYLPFTGPRTASDCAITSTLQPSVPCVIMLPPRFYLSLGSHDS